MIFQIVLTVCLLGILVSTWRRGKRIRAVATVVGLINLSAIFFVWQPGRLNELAHFLGIGRGADLLMYVFFVCVTFELLMVRIREREHMEMITQLARAIALRDGQPPARP